MKRTLLALLLVPVSAFSAEYRMLVSTSATPAGIVGRHMTAHADGGNDTMAGKTFSDIGTVSLSNLTMKGKLDLGTNVMVGSAGTAGISIDARGQVGIGSNVPLAQLHVVWPTNLNSTTNIAACVVIDTFNDTSPAVIQRRAGGSPSALSSPTAGTLLGGWAIRPYLDTNWATGSKGSMLAYAAENHSATASGSYLNFSTCGTGTVSVAERMRLDSQGNLGINTTVPAYHLDVNGSARIVNNLTVSGSLYSPYAQLQSNVTITVTNGMPVATIKAMMPPQRNLGTHSVTIQFPVGTNYWTAALSLQDYVNGTINILGQNVASTQCYTTQTSRIVMTNSVAGNIISCNRVKAALSIRDLCFQSVSASTWGNILAFTNSGWVTVNECYFISDSTSYSAAVYSALHSGTRVYHNVFNQYSIAVQSDFGSYTVAQTNIYFGTRPSRGYYARCGKISRMDDVQLGTTDNQCDYGGNIITSAGLIEP